MLQSYIPSYSTKDPFSPLMDACFNRERTTTQTLQHLTHLVWTCSKLHKVVSIVFRYRDAINTYTDCREVAALGRSLAAVGGRLEALLVAAASQGLDQAALTCSTILAGPHFRFL